MAKQLMDAGKKELKRLSVPPHSFTISSFPLPLFSLITLEPDEKAILTSVEVKFDNPTDVTLGFTNALTAPLSLAELLKDAATTSRKVSANWSELIDYSANKDEIYNLLINPLDATLRAAKSNMAGQEFLISESGILGRKREGEAFAKEQMILQNNCLLFTGDGWQTLKTALGKVVVGEKDGNPVTAYGLVADVIVGNLLVGQNLAIKNSNSTVLIGGNGIEIKNGVDTVFKADTKGNALLKGDIYAKSLTLAEGVKIGYSSIDGVPDLGLYVKKDANDQIVAMLNAATDKLIINSNRLVINSTNFKLSEDGSVTATNGNFAGVINATSGTFTGTVEADAGNIGGFAIENNSLKTLNFLLSADATGEANTFTSSLNFFSVDNSVSTQINEQGVIANSVIAKEGTINGGILNFCDKQNNVLLDIENNVISGKDTKIILSSNKADPSAIVYTYYPKFRFIIIQDSPWDLNKVYQIGVGFYKNLEHTNLTQQLKQSKTIYIKMTKFDGTIMEDIITIPKGENSISYQTKTKISNPQLSFDKVNWYGTTSSDGENSFVGTMPSFTQLGEVSAPDKQIIAIEGNVLPADTLDAENTADTRKFSKYNIGSETGVWQNIYCKTIHKQSEQTLSDRRVKNSIEPLDKRYSELLYKLQPVKYKYNNDVLGALHAGFIAQDVKKAMDECGISPAEFALYGNSNGEGYLSLCYDELIAVCILEIQNLRKELKYISQKKFD